MMNISIAVYSLVCLFYLSVASGLVTQEDLPATMRKWLGGVA